MSRRDPHLLRLLAQSPWWIGPLLAAFLYLALRWGAPSIAEGHRALQPLATQLSAWAPWIAGIFLLPLPFAVGNACLRRRLLDTQSGIASIRDLSWRRFEYLIGEAYRRQGYTVVQRGGSGSDGGVDLELRRSGIKIIVQCKHWRARKVGVRVLRELHGALAHQEADAAIVVTSGDFTPAASSFADGKALTLVNGCELVTMIAAVRTSSNRMRSRSEPYIGAEATSPR